MTRNLIICCDDGVSFLCWEQPDARLRSGSCDIIVLLIYRMIHIYYMLIKMFNYHLCPVGGGIVILENSE